MRMVSLLHLLLTRLRQLLGTGSLRSSVLHLVLSFWSSLRHAFRRNGSSCLPRPGVVRKRRQGRPSSPAPRCSAGRSCPIARSATPGRLSISASRLPLSVDTTVDPSLLTAQDGGPGSAVSFPARAGSPDSLAPSVHTTYTAYTASHSRPATPTSVRHSFYNLNVAGNTGASTSRMSLSQASARARARNASNVTFDQYLRSRPTSRVSGRVPAQMPNRDTYRETASMIEVAIRPPLSRPQTVHGGIELTQRRDRSPRSLVRSLSAIGHNRQGSDGTSFNIGVREPTPPPDADSDSKESSTALDPSSSSDAGAAHVDPVAELGLPLVARGGQNQSMHRVAAPGHSSASLSADGSRDTLRRWNVIPISTMYVSWPRYSQYATIEKESPELERIKPVTLDYLHDEPYPLDWLRHTHPEGDVYFYHPHRRIYTRANLHDEEVLAQIHVFASHIDVVKARHPTIAADAELVLELDAEDGDCFYYMIDHTHRTLFWLNPYDPKSMLSELEGVTSPAHIKHEIEFHYWSHWELFPHHHTVTQEMIEELIGILVHCSYDALSSPTSTAPYSSSDLQSMLTMAKNIQLSGDQGGYGACVYGRMMSLFAHERFLQYAGTRAARLNRDQSVFEDKGSASRRTWLITALSLPLFFAPDAHLKALERIWVDKMINDVPWRKFIKKLKEEWQDLILLSTVLLAANVSLLEVPNIDPDVTARDRTVDEIMCYVSIVASIGSIILGLLLIRQYHKDTRETAQEAARHLNEHHHPKRGLETLAILYALPYAGLMWGMVTFLSAFACLCFRSTSTTTFVPVACVIVVVSALVLWCVVTGWENQPQSRWNEIGTDSITVFGKLTSGASGAGERFKEYFWPRFRRREPSNAGSGGAPVGEA